ncbi:glycosyltransferase [Saccharomonospora xinjiangensis]|uniref:Glycosyl transferase, UDP-glucuronosyltransferase n=1 Tax=Saccharomonospora xinjiangensis XJ-54 TaxID=882086 RepID=I0UWW0_9PSEU|nr:glycosyltransferase [Saccharomonospora xinjiangensis]EID52363.1 glycosyl transferase, UDP-glucuronosyltransferase [Saccharomonospora xinjiangensis XJ-54]
MRRSDVNVSDDAAILFLSAGNAGLISPLYALAGELLRRGVRPVWFASSDERAEGIRELSGVTPINFYSLGPYRPEFDPANWSDAVYHQVNRTSRLRGFAAFMEQVMDSEYAEERYRRALAAIDHVRPGLIVVDLNSPWAIDAAQTRGVPYVVNVATPISYAFSERLPMSFPGPLSGLPRSMTGRQRVTNVAFKILRLGALLASRKALDNMRFYRRRHAQGLKNPGSLLSRYCDEAEVVLGNSVFGIEYPFSTAPADVRMVGTLVPETRERPERHRELFEWLDARPSTIYIGLGSMMRLSEQQSAALVAAISRLAQRHHVVWSLAAAQQRLLPRELPPNLRIETWVPQTEVVAHPHVRLFITHGGNGAHHGLYFGKPLLVLPHSWETRDLAVRLMDGGAALMVDDVYSLTAEEIVTKVHRLLTEKSFTERADHWRRRLVEAGGVRVAADLVLAHRPTSRADDTSTA